MSYDIIQEFIDEPRGNKLFIDLKEPGSYHVRLLTDPDLLYKGQPNRFFAGEVTYLIGAGDTKRALQSPKTYGEECPLDEIEKEADEDIKAIMSNYQLFSKIESYYFPVLLLNFDEARMKSKIVGFRILKASRALAIELAKWINHRDFKEIGEDGIADLQEGTNIEIIRTGIKLKTEWEIKPYRKSSAVPEKWLDQMESIQDMIDKKSISDEELETELWDYFQGEGLDLLDEVKAARKNKAARISGRDSSRNKTRNKPAPEPDDDDDDDNDDPEPEEKKRGRPGKYSDRGPEETKSVKKRGRPANKAPEEMPDPEPDEDDEDPEPVKKRGRPAKKVEPEESPSTERKRGRPAKKQEPEPEPEVKRRGRPAANKKEEPVKAGRGRPKKVETEKYTSRDAEGNKPLKKTAAKAPVVKRGRPKRALL